MYPRLKLTVESQNISILRGQVPQVYQWCGRVGRVIYGNYITKAQAQKYWKHEILSYSELWNVPVKVGEGLWGMSGKEYENTDGVKWIVD